MKKITILFCVLVLLLALSACKQQTGDRVGNETEKAQHPSNDVTPATQEVPSTDSETEDFISRQSAIDIALQKASLSKDSVYDIDAELDREKKGTFWEVDFETREREYSYEIDAVTGKIVREKSERND